MHIFTQLTPTLPRLFLLKVPATLVLKYLSAIILPVNLYDDGHRVMMAWLNGDYLHHLVIQKIAAKTDKSSILMH